MTLLITFEARYESKYGKYRIERIIQVAEDFIAELTQHIPGKGVQYIRRYGLYASRTKALWSKIGHIVRLAPRGWKEKHPGKIDNETPVAEKTGECSVSNKGTNSAWARLIAKVLEAGPLKCSKCGSTMKVVAIITQADEVRKILMHLVKIGRSPPGFDPSSLN